jgi:hypothetical protein
MKHNVYKVCFSTALLSFGVSCSTSTVTNGYRTTVAMKNGVELALTVPEVTAMSQSVNITLKLANRSDLAVETENYNGINELGIYVWDDRHQTPIITPLGREYNINQPRPSVYFQLSLSWLKPGKSCEWDIDLAKYYTFTPGTYHMTASLLIDRMGGTRDTMKSIPGFLISVNDIHFDIKFVSSLAKYPPLGN